MNKRMLIDATQPEETRVVVMDGVRLTEYDLETASKKQLKGNIYLARVVRVEPSLQAAFVEYGGNRHGFLAFGEIHPDYYQIPVADRQRLLEWQEQEARAQEEAEDAAQPDTDSAHAPGMASSPEDAANPATDSVPAEGPAAAAPFEPESGSSVFMDPAMGPQPDIDARLDSDLETLGGEHDIIDEAASTHRLASGLLRHYKIQEVIRRRQILLVQVVKEERGTKGAALTTYISLAGRYSVLMPNSPHGGGVSRKITTQADRQRLKEAAQALDLPNGMGLIIRTAGASRPKAEIIRDGETLLTLWDDIRQRTLQSTAPMLIHEEASLIKRALRDSYAGDVDEVLVDGEEGWRVARDFMRLMMPSHVRKVILWRETGQSLFSRYQVEVQLDGMMRPTAQLRSGGYLVINQTEALVAIDVNSGRSTRERGVEETALRTNLEAAEEVARQLRLRDLAGLIVIDFIDMESRRNNAAVERRLKESLAIDRARIQVGQISHFGLMEMSRQRLRPSVGETSFVACNHCGGTGLVRSTESAALHVLRAIEEEGARRRAAEIIVHVASAVILYILNHKRDRLTEIEQRYGMQIVFQPDNTLPLPQLRIDRIRPYQPHAIQALSRGVNAEPDGEADEPEADESADDDSADSADADADADTATSAQDGDAPRRRRRRRRGGRGQGGDERGARTSDDETSPEAQAADQADGEAGSWSDEGNSATAPQAAVDDQPTACFPHIDNRPPLSGAPPRRRGRRPVRHLRAEAESSAAALGAPVTGERAPFTAPDTAAAASNESEARPVYNGPTPADPFGGSRFDIFDALEQASMGNAPPDSQNPTESDSLAAKPVTGEGAGSPPPKRRGWWRR